MVELHDAGGAADDFFSLSDNARAVCAAIAIDIEADTRFGDWFSSQSTVLESPAQLAKGLICADFVGAYTYLGGDLTTILHVERIGRFCAIAANVMTGQWEHPSQFLSPHPLFQGARFKTKNVRAFIARNYINLEAAGSQFEAIETSRFREITIGNDVWIGEGAFIRRGVAIGDGAIVGARSVVVKDVPPYAIVAGSPARLIRYRFEGATIERLLAIGWWRYDFHVLDGVNIANIDQAIDMMQRNIENGKTRLYAPPMVCIEQAENVSLCRYDNASGSIVGLDERV